MRQSESQREWCSLTGWEKCDFRRERDSVREDDIFILMKKIKGWEWEASILL